MRNTIGTRYTHDAALSSKDLESIDRTLYEAKESELTARSVVTLKTDDHPGAETISYDMVTKRGAAKIYAYGGADDIPLVDIDVKRHTQKVFGIVTGFRIDIQEKRAAQMAGRPIDSMKASTARRAVAEKENDFFYKGDPAYNAEGLLNFTGIQTFAVDNNAAGTSSKWKDKTAAEIIVDIRETRKKVNEIQGLEATTLLLPPSQYEDLDRPVNPEKPELTIKKYLMDLQWFRTIQKAPQLIGVGDSDTDSMIAMDASAEVVQLSLPLDITRSMPYELPNYTTQFNVEERTGGAVIRYPIGICRADGI